jgi:hypothetical protein
MKKIFLATVIISNLFAEPMSFKEFVTSFKQEVGAHITDAKNHISNRYEKNKIIDSKHAVVSTAQDVVVDSGKAFLGMSKEAYKEAKVQYYKYKIRQLEKEKDE